MFRVLRYVAATAILAALLALPFLKPTASNSNQVSVIVELRDEPAAVYKARTEKSGGTVSDEQLQTYRNQISAKQDQFLSALSASGVSYTLISRNVKNFDGSLAATVPLRYTLVYDGLALNVPYSAIDAIRAMPNVKGVRPDATLRTELNHSVKYIRAPQVYNGEEQDVSSQFYSSNPANDLGQDMNVAIIDTGVDWTHPMFGGDVTPPRLAVLPPGSTQDKTNKKVIYYLPLADEAAEDGFGHGTHVASTVAGYLAQTLDGVQLHGVAPQAKIMSYKVCSDVEVDLYELSAVAGAPDPLGGCDTSNIIMALEDSVSPFTLSTVQGKANPASALLPKPKANVINMSLGGGGGPDEPTAVAASNAALAGAVVVAASGNDGPREGSTGAPAAGVHVISVAASSHPGNVATAYQADVVDGQQGMEANEFSGSAAPPDSMTNNYVFCGLADTPDQVPATVAGHIALAQRGSTVDLSASGTGVIVNKAAQAAAKGAIALLVYNNVDGELADLNAFATTIPVFGLSKANGELLKSLIGSNAVGAISAKQVRIRKSTAPFMGDIAAFSSRGPVQGYGQVKPDVSAPGVQVLAACPPASFLGALAVAASATRPNYIMIDGTSMATPHTAGAAALIKQAHRNWTADIVRTVMINTATNMRSNDGATKPDGTTTDSVLAQGGGLIDVFHAVNAKALMGVAGDGIDKPSILGSYSFGSVPVANSRITYTAPIEVTVSDLSGQGGVYNLAIANNRDLQLTGINVGLSQSSVSVPANGSVTFTVNASFDGNLLRDTNTAEVNGTSVTFRGIEMQWYVTAQRADGGESLRMPFYFKPDLSLPAEPTVQSLTQQAMVPLGTAGQMVASGADYVDVPFQVSDNTYQIEATTEWFDLPTGQFQDIDYQLLDPQGQVIASSGHAAGSSEFVRVRINGGGTYTHRLVGFTNVVTTATINTRLSKGPAAPTAQTIPGDFVDAQNRNVDFDGTFTLNWLPVGGEQGFEIEQSSASNPDWQIVADVNGRTTSYDFTNLANDTYSFRVRGIQPGQIGKYVTNPGNTVSVVVDARSQVDITSMVSYPVSNISFSGGIWQQDVNLVNNSTKTYLPYVDFNVIGLTSTTGVRVINADNNQSGTSPANFAQFGFSNKLGSDQLFSPAETTASRTIRFQDTAAEMFSWDVQVTAYQPAGNVAGANGIDSPNSGSGGSSSSSSGTAPSANLRLTKVTAVMRFTANPLTKTVTSKLISLK
jgi:subtilisin family serine protease